MQDYQIIDMGLSKFETSEATSINNLGQICGSYQEKNKTFAFFYDETEKKFNYTNIPTSSMLVINNKSEIYGSYWSRTNDGVWEFDQESTFRWENPQSYFTYFNFYYMGYPSSQRQASFTETKRVILFDANDHGETILVNSSTIDNNYRFDNFKYRTWVGSDYFEEITSPQFQAGLKINNNSLILGCFFENAPSPMPFGKKTPKVSIYNLKNGNIDVLPFPGAAFGNDLNDKDQIAGVFFDPKNGKVQGFLTDIVSSDFISIENFSPTALNNHGLMVGKFYEGEKKNKPALWDNGCLCDVTELVQLVDNQGQVWDSIDALFDVNDEGAIVGKGTLNGKKHGLLLIPKQ